MRKIDKLLLKSFLGPFFLTFLVVVFILLMQHMLKYMDDILGKDLGAMVIIELLMYFAVFMTPVALPLAVLLSALMTYGNLGEHFELTAIKSAGISLIRTLRPLFVFVCFVTVFAFLSNNYLVPKAALKAYSLLYDIKQKKPSLDLKEGTFYDGIPGYSIKVEKKDEDGIGLKNLIIYNHAKRIGNSQIIIADSGRMEMIMNGRYLSLELFNGKRYAESESTRSIQKRNKGEPGEFLRSRFDRSQYIFSLASFDLDQTPEDLFAGNKMMKDISKLSVDIDSMRDVKVVSKYTVYKTAESLNMYHMKNIWQVPKGINKRKAELDSLERLKLMAMDTLKEERDTSNRIRPKSNQYAYTNPLQAVQDRIDTSLKNLPTSDSSQNQEINTTEDSLSDDAEIEKKIRQKFYTRNSDSAKFVAAAAKQKRAPIINPTQEVEDMPVVKTASFNENIEELRKLMSRKNNEQKALKLALTKTRQAKTRVATQLRKLEGLDQEIAGHIIKLHQKYSHAMACMIMFLIGAPLGAIIKRGGLGVPVLISIFFFIIFYVLVISGQNWGEEGAMDPVISVWVADMVLLPFGVVFMIQAKNDARFLETDFYNVFISKFKKKPKIKTKEEEDK